MNIPKSQVITVDIAPDGSIKIDAKGFTGPECAKATQALRDALGETVEFTKKPEYLAQEVQQTQVQKAQY
jgi:hypothetical protein